MIAKRNTFKFKIDSNGEVPKFRQLIDSVINAISENRLDIGTHLPSVNVVCRDYNLSRDTVFKAYSILKEQGVIDSVPNKGYFIARDVRKVFLFLDTFKAYKEVLYGAFVKNLPENIVPDLHFHHYNPEVFRRQIEESIGKYSKYVIMPFENPIVEIALNRIPPEKLLVIDWNLYSGEAGNVLYQNFGSSVYEGLSEALPLIQKYKEFVFLYPEYTNHPYESVVYFEKFCRDNQINYKIIKKSDGFSVVPGVAYFSVSDRMLGIFLEQCREKNLEPGRDTGIISYNETPMKKFIYKGVTVISTDFQMMGRKAAEFVSNDKKMQILVPTKLSVRESL